MLLVRHGIALTTATALLVLLTSGCGQPADAPEAADVADAQGPLPAVSLSGDQIEQIRQLPDDDADAALSQTVCPITGEALGTMGKPAKVVLDGHPVFLCCAGCETEATEDADATLARLGPLVAPASSGADSPAPEADDVESSDDGA